MSVALNETASDWWEPEVSSSHIWFCNSEPGLLAILRLELLEAIWDENFEATVLFVKEKQKPLK